MTALRLTGYATKLPGYEYSRTMNRRGNTPYSLLRIHSHQAENIRAGLRLLPTTTTGSKISTERIHVAHVKEINGSRNGGRLEVGRTSMLPAQGSLRVSQLRSIGQVKTVAAQV